MIARRLIFIFLLSLPVIGWAGDGNPQSGFLLSAKFFKPVAIKNLPPEVDALGYRDNELPSAYVSDLNGDGVPDYLFVAQPVICGTGGCPYLLVDGKNGRTRGEFFGATIALLNQKINGYPVIQSLSKQDLATYVFDGTVYRLAASSLLEEQGMAAWLESLGEGKKP